MRLKEWRYIDSKGEKRVGDGTTVLYKNLESPCARPTA